MIDAARKAELRALCEKATKGPWEFRRLLCSDDRGMGYVSDANDKDIAHTGERSLLAEENEANARLMTAARTAVPELLARVDELEEALGQIAQRANERYGEIPLMAERDTVYAMYNKARAALEGRHVETD